MGMKYDRKIVVVTRATQLASLERKFSTRSRAKFEIMSSKRRELARAGVAPGAVESLAAAAFADVDLASQTYDQAVAAIRADLDAANFQLPVQAIDRDFLPNFVFGPDDVVVTIGQDGLVANTAKYVLGLPIVAINPDPKRIDGVLLPFAPDQARSAVQSALRGNAKFREVTLAQATLPDGQKLLAFNELFIGKRDHTSARYRLSAAGKTEVQSSSGVLVGTGAGSTGWLSSVFSMAAGVAAAFAPDPALVKGFAVKMEWSDPRLMFIVREPFVSRTSSASLVAGLVNPGTEMVIESEMPADGVIFSDGVDSDFIEFNSGATVRIAAAKDRARIVVPG